MTLPRRLLALVLGLSAAAAAPAQGVFGPPSGSAIAPAQGLFVLTPREPQSTSSQSMLNVLGRTVAGARVWVAGEPVTVYATGVFARDNLPLAMGPNRVLIEVQMPDGNWLQQTVLVTRETPVPPPAPPGEALDPSTLPPATSPPHLYVAGPTGVQLLHGLHQVRLGGPFLAELPAGTLLPVSGQLGQHYRISLAADTTAWATVESLTPAPAGTQRPHAAFTSLSLRGSEQGDVITIPLPPNMPYAIRTVADAHGGVHLELDLFGAHRASTWISHMASARLIREVSVQQPADGRLRVLVSLNQRRLWGWRVERTASALVLTVRPAPALAAAGSLQPLAGLRVALEPGHGGPSNLGAIGATGVPEKDINRWTTEALQAELEAAGAQVSIVRQADDNPSLRERADGVTASDAQVFISVHANATETQRGVLRVQGTSTYYHHANGRDLAAAVRARLLEQTGLQDFGLIGAFNYAPIRWVTWMPAILVEQAFMTHPADEALMLDASGRSRLARAVRLGLEDWLRSP